MIKLGEAAKFLRNRLGLSQREAALQLGISHIHVNNIENGKASPTAMMLEKYYDAWGIDLYMLAVVKFSADERLPESVRSSVDEMLRAWDQDIEAVVAGFETDGHGCSEFKS